MARAREIARDRTRTRRAILKRLAEEEAKARRARLSQVLDIVAQMLSHEGFVALASTQGIRLAPRRLLQRESGNDPEHLNDNGHSAAVLDFVIAWKFIFPMFPNAEIVLFLQRTWPGFIEEFKDMFIALVTNGPFLDERHVKLNSDYFQ